MCLSIYPSFSHVLNVSVVLLSLKKDMADIMELENIQRKAVIKKVIQLPLEVPL